MIWVALLLLCLAFIESFVAFRVPQAAKALLASGSASITFLSSPDLDDAAKEKFARTQSLKLLKQTSLFAARMCAVGAVVAIVYVILRHSGFVAARALDDAATSWEALVVLSVFGVIYARIRYGIRR